ncbi:DDE-type integrase/transposase/recombinase, partial [Micrococcus luteus]
LTDISEHWAGDSKLYLCAVKDVFSNRIVGYSINRRMSSQLAVDALQMALGRRGGKAEVQGCRVHSDRGSQGGFNRSSQHPLGITGGMGDGKQGLGEEDQ